MTCDTAQPEELCVTGPHRVVTGDLAGLDVTVEILRWPGECGDPDQWQVDVTGEPFSPGVAPLMISRAFRDFAAAARLFHETHQAIMENIQ